jgi:hypothetical protein
MEGKPRMAVAGLDIFELLELALLLVAVGALSGFLAGLFGIGGGAILVPVFYECFSNRPFGVKRFQTIHHHSVDVARGLVLLFGIGTKALPSWDSRTGWNNLSGGLTVNRTAEPSRHANSPHPSSREGHLPTARWNSSFLLSGLILNGFHAAATAACSRVHRNSVPSTQMRCMMTANRRAKATIAFFIPRRLAICMAQALSHDHFFERSMLCAAS